MVATDFCYPRTTATRLWEFTPPFLIKTNGPKLWQLFTQPNLASGIERTLTRLRSRLPEDVYQRTLASILLQYRYSLWVFPTFICHIQEFLNEEWLALVDFHKDFHRDHIYHQPQVAEIARTIMNDLTYLVDDEEVVPSLFRDKKWRTELESLNFGRDGKFSLVEIAAIHMACPSRDNEYLHSFCQGLRLPRPMFILDNNKSRMALLFWKKTIFDAVITAALFHDIGYPFQFLSNINGELNPLTMLDLRFAQATDAFFEDISRRRLFMWALAGYRDFQHYPTPHQHSDELQQLFHRSLHQTHGMPGALSFLYMNDELRRYKDIWEPPAGTLTMEMAVTGILMHDMQKQYASTERMSEPYSRHYYLNVRHPELRVRFRTDPVSYIVTLADLIEDYYRVNIQPYDGPPPSASPDVRLRAEVRVKRTRVCFDDSSKQLIIKYFFNQEHVHAMNQQRTDFNNKIYTQFFERQQGYLKAEGMFSEVVLDAGIDH